MLAWIQTGAELQVVWQVPYASSGGFADLGFIVVGVTVVNIAAKTQESARRRVQSDELAAVLAGIRKGLEGDRS